MRNTIQFSSAHVNRALYLESRALTMSTEYITPKDLSLSTIEIGFDARSLHSVSILNSPSS